MYHRSRGIRLLALLVVLPCALVLLFAPAASAQSEPGGGDPYENNIALLQDTHSAVGEVLTKEKEELEAARADLAELSNEADPAIVRSYQKKVDEHEAEVRRLEGLQARIQEEINAEFARLFEPVIPDGPHAPPAPEPPDPIFAEARLLGYEHAKEDTEAARAEVERLRQLDPDRPEEENLKLQDALDEQRKAEERERRLAEGYQDYTGEDAEEALARKQANEAAGTEGTTAADELAAPEPGPAAEPSFWPGTGNRCSTA
jgi:hypothetical protein